MGKTTLAVCLMLLPAALCSCGKKPHEVVRRPPESGAQVGNAVDHPDERRPSLLAKLLGPRLVRVGTDRNRLTPTLRKKLSVKLWHDHKPGCTVRDVVELCRGMGVPVSAEADAMDRSASTAYWLMDQPVGYHLYWFTRLSGTSTVVRGQEIILVRTPSKDDVVVDPCVLAPPSRWVDVLGRSLQRRVSSYEFVETPLIEVAQALSDLTQTGFVVEYPVWDKAIDLRVEDETVKAILDKAVAQAGCDYEVCAGAIHIFPKE